MRDRSFLALCALILVNQMGFGIITPVLPGYARSFGLDASAIGLIIGIYGFARFLANVPAGQLAERRGRRQVLIIGTVITSVASALMATATNLPLLLVYRLLAGLGAATVLTGGQIMVGDIATPENRGRMMSTYQGFFLIGVGLGPAPGGLLADAFGLRAPFVAYAAFSALACLFAMVLIRETRPAYAPVEAETAGTPSAGDGRRIRQTLLSRPFLLIGAVSFVHFFARTGAVFTAVPLLGNDRAGLSASEIGYAMTAVNLLNIAMLYPSGQLADRLGRKLAIAPATIACGLSLLVWGWSTDFLTFFASAALWGFGSGISGPSPAAYVADLAPADLRGRIFGYFRSVSDFGYIIGPLLIGALIDRAGYAVPLMVTGAMFFTVGTAFWLLAPEFHRTSRLAGAPGTT